MPAALKFLLPALAVLAVIFVAGRLSDTYTAKVAAAVAAAAVIVLVAIYLLTRFVAWAARHGRQGEER
jgi:hypothetical protein